MNFEEYKQSIIEAFEHIDEWALAILHRDIEEDGCQTMAYCYDRGFSPNDAARYIFYTVQPNELENCPREDTRDLLTEDYCIRKMSEISERVQRLKHSR